MRTRALECERRGRLEGWLPMPGWPRPVRYVLAAVLWPIGLVLFAVGGLLAVLLYGVWALLAVALAISVLYLLGRGGVQGFEGLSAHPLVFIPRNWITGLSLIVGIPTSVWWLRNTFAAWLAKDAREAADNNLRLELEKRLGRWPSYYEVDAYLHEQPDALPPLRDQSRWLKARVVLVAAIACASAAVLLWEVSKSFTQGAANAPLAAVVLIAVLAGVGVAVYWVSERRMPLGRRAPFVAPIAVLLAGAVFGALIGYNDRSSGLLRSYCEYGAVSKAQLQGCLDHVTDAYIRSLDTDAARFARGDLNQCLDDAGPYCANRLDQMNNSGE